MTEVDPTRSKEHESSAAGLDDAQFLSGQVVQAEPLYGFTGGGAVLDDAMPCF